MSLNPQSQNEGHAPTSGPESVPVFYWRDARGVPWTLEADERELRLASHDESFSVPRERWAGDVTITPSRGGNIIRVTGPNRDVGFLIGPEALEFARRLGKDVADPPAATDADAGPMAPRGPVLFPKMDRFSVIALCLAAVAFVPVFGYAAALASIVLLAATRRRVRPAREYNHVRSVRRITAAWLVLSLLVCTVATLNAVRLRSPDPGVSQGPTVVDAGPGATSLYASIAAGIIVVLLSLSVHEAAHAITALWNGDDYARSLGRVTLNPLAHIDPFGTVALPAMLALSGLPAFGYARPVPVIPSRMLFHRKSDIYVSAAGPLSNLLIAALCMSLYLLIGCGLSLLSPDVRVSGYDWPGFDAQVSGVAGAKVITAVLRMLGIAVQLNLLLAFFNLLPIPPLDGSHVAGNLFPQTIGRFFDMIRPFQIIVFIALMYTGVMRWMMMPTLVLVMRALYWMVETATGLA
ncbi:MAG: hypothetical protein FLDDKLPJ_00958 [Phycisphaerae bacterium]|nr:hypothetical protein [Phycisphaerae bacterium]